MCCMGDMNQLKHLTSRQNEAYRCNNYDNESERIAALKSFCHRSVRISTTGKKISQFTHPRKETLNENKLIIAGSLHRM